MDTPPALAVVAVFAGALTALAGVAVFAGTLTALAGGFTAGFTGVGGGG